MCTGRDYTHVSCVDLQEHHVSGYSPRMRGAGVSGSGLRAQLVLEQPERPQRRQVFRRGRHPPGPHRGHASASRTRHFWFGFQAQSAELRSCTHTSTHTESDHSHVFTCTATRVRTHTHAHTHTHTHIHSDPTLSASQGAFKFCHFFPASLAPSVAPPGGL